MNRLTSLTTVIADRLRLAWQRHCDIIHMTYVHDGSADRARTKVTSSRSSVPDVTRGLLRQA